MNIWDKLIDDDFDEDDQELANALGLNFELRFERQRLIRFIAAMIKEDG